MPPITFTPEEISIYYAEQVPLLRQSEAAEWRGPCPIHEGTNDSFVVQAETGLWYCHSDCGIGGDILELEEALTERAFTTCMVEVYQRVGRLESEERNGRDACDGISAPTERLELTESNDTSGGWQEVERYPYEYVDGKLLFQVVRYVKSGGQKSFRQCRPNGQGGFIWNLEGIERVPYRLSKVLEAGTVYLPEGEKDVHTLEGWGFVASCSPGGAGGSRVYAHCAQYFAGRHIIILPDN